MLQFPLFLKGEVLGFVQQPSTLCTTASGATVDRRIANRYREDAGLIQLFELEDAERGATIEARIIEKHQIRVPVGMEVLQHLLELRSINATPTRGGGVFEYFHDRTAFEAHLSLPLDSDSELANFCQILPDDNQRSSRSE